MSEAVVDHGNVLGDSHHPHGHHDGDNDHGHDHDDIDLDLALQQRQMKRASLPSRTRTPARHQKRLTLNFPINIPPPGTVTAPASAVPSLASPGAMSPLTQSQSSARHSLALNTPLMLDTLQQPDDGSAILTAIASQERKVLELKEELQREEAELSSLKRQWVSTEKIRKQTVVNHHAEQLVSLRSPAASMSSPPTPLEAESSPSGSATPDGTRRSKDLERRRSMRTPVTTSGGSGVSTNGRRVFQGSHTRMLSLLSASTDSGTGNTSNSNNNNNTTTASNTSNNNNKKTKQDDFKFPRSTTLPLSLDRLANNTADETDIALVQSSLGDSTDDMITQWRKTMPPPSREALMRTGKQMASDLREGLWTFLEDIRQATVGEEGINATEVRGGMSPTATTATTSINRRSPSSSSARTRGTSTGNSGKDTAATDIDSSFWNEFGIDTPQKPDTLVDTTDSKSNDDHLDEWNVWEVPKPRNNLHTPSSSRSTVESSKNDQSPRSQTSSPRTSSSTTRSVNGWQGKLVCLSFFSLSPLLPLK